MARPLYWVGAFSVRHRYVVVAIWVLGAVALALGAHKIGSITSDNLSLPGYDSQKAQASTKATDLATALTSSLNPHCAVAYQLTRAFMATRTPLMTRMTVTPTFHVCLASHAVANCAAIT